MRSLFHRVEKPQYVSAVPPAETVTDIAQKQGTTSIETGTAISTTDKTVKQQRVKKNLTPEESLMRKRRLALTTIAVSLVVGGRWFVANVEPTYPVGEGVHAPNTAPEWGKMKQPNAATFYMAAADALDLEAVNETLHGVKSGTLDLVDQPVAVQKPPVAIAQPAFVLLRQGMKYPYVPDFQTNYFKSDPIEAVGFARPVPNFIIQREMARLLAAESSMRGAQGNHAGAMESSLDAVRLGVDQAQGHSLIEGMIGILIQGIGAKEGIKHVTGLSAEEARVATSRLEKTLAAEQTFAQFMTHERNMTFEFLKELYSRGNVGGLATLENESMGPTLKGPIGRVVSDAMLMYYTKQGLVNDFASYNDLILARVKLPYQQAKQLPPIAESSNRFVRIVVPNYQRGFMQTTTKAAWNRILLAQLAVQAYRGEHNGEFPPSLTELTTGEKPYLNTVPSDPFSQSGSDPLRYNARSGKVYSVGENSVDDGNTGDDNAELFKK